MLFDLHIHSTFSDGWLTPEKIVETAVAKKLQVISLTDHDCVSGIPLAMRTAQHFADKIKIIPGVELSTKLSNKIVEKASVHILGYFIDYTNKSFVDKLSSIRNIRVHRFAMIKEKLEKLGYKVNLTVKEAEQHSMGRPHLANDLVKRGYFPTIQAAFDKLLAKDKPAYVSLDTLTQKEAIDLIHQVGGKAFLAHPVEVRSVEAVEELLDTLPFDGLEIYHPSVENKDGYAMWIDLAKQYKLMLSGGSDFHGSPDRFPNELGIFTVNDNQVDKIFGIDL